MDKVNPELGMYEGGLKKAEPKCVRKCIIKYENIDWHYGYENITWDNFRSCILSCPSKNKNKK